MKSSIEASDRAYETRNVIAPLLAIKKIGIVSRDYNRDKDFSSAYRDILEILEREGCDTALFSLYSIIRRKSFNPTPPASLKKLKCILVEEFEETQDPKGKMKRRSLAARGASSDS
jgi:hypothetical protein